MVSQGLGNPQYNKEGKLERLSASECVEFTESEVAREDRAKAVGNFAAGFFSFGSAFYPASKSTPHTSDIAWFSKCLCFRG